MARPAPLLLLALCSGLATAACSVGEIGERDDDPATAPVPEGPRASTAACTENDPGSSVVRRLTRFEYDNTVRDLLGEKRALARALFPKEELSYGLGNNAEALSVSPLLAEQYMEAAESIASGAVSRARLNEVLACDPLTLGEPACARAFIERFARRAYRRPATVDEIARLTKVYDDARVDAPLTTGIARVIEVVLQSPQFLYRVEQGTTRSGPRPESSPSPDTRWRRACRTFSGEPPRTRCLQRLRLAIGSGPKRRSLPRRSACSPIRVPTMRSHASMRSGSRSTPSTRSARAPRPSRPSTLACARR